MFLSISEQGRAQRKLTALLALCFLAILASCAQSQEFFDPESIDRFDGKSWGGLTFGTTTAEIKSKFKTSKGAYRPQAMVLPQSSGADVNVQVLMDSAGDSSRLVGFRLAYRDTAPEVGQIAGSIGEKPQTWYPRERYLDWHVALFSKHGIAAFVEKSGGNETVSLLILTSPSRVGKIVQGFVQRKTPISSLSKKYPESQRIATFGQALVSIREDGLSMANSDSFRQELEDKIRKQSLSSRLRYRSGSSGSLRVTLKLIKPRGQDGRVDVSASFSGNSSFGTITSFGSHSEKFGRSLFGIVNVDKVRARYAFDQALSDTIRSAESSLQKRIPRDPVALSHQTWDAAVTRGTL